MPVKVVLGLQHGDEGKGRIVDDIVQDWADIVVRFQGGGNAGHTVYDKEGNKFVTHTLPVGVLNKTKFNLITKGCLINLLDVFEEIKSLEVNPDNLKISGLCPIVEPVHLLKDRMKYTDKIGTTSKGIGPAYSDFYARDAILFRDFINNPADTVQKMKYNFEAYRKSSIVTYGFLAATAEVEKQLNLITENYKELHKSLSKHILNNEYILHDLIDYNILLEGAQGSGLGINTDNYPNVTSSYPSIGGALNSTNLNHSQIDEVIGVIKSYKTKVGSGEFPSKCNEKDAAILAEVGQEFGATTGRPRQCGWLDVNEVVDAARQNGVSHICVVKTDVLTHIEEPCVYIDNKCVKIQTINNVDHNEEPFRNLLMFIKNKTKAKDVSYTTGPKRGQIVWKPKV